MVRVVPDHDGGETSPSAVWALWFARWRQSATESEDVFEQHRQHIAAPGGTDWEGDAKDAALDRVTADTRVVQRQGDVMREAAVIAENGGGVHHLEIRKRRPLLQTAFP